MRRVGCAVSEVREPSTSQERAARPRLRGAVGWSYLMDAGGQALTAAFSFVLAGLLGPNAFGVLALALVYVAFIEMLQRQGMTAAIVQRRDLTDAHLDSAFWMVLGFSALLSLVSVGLSGWWADVNDAPQLRPVVVALSLLLPIQALVLVQEATLRRSMRFRLLAVRDNAAAVIGGICGVVAALLGAGLWALVVQQLVTAAVRLVILWTSSGWAPRRRFSWLALRDLLAFSTGSFLTSLAIFVNNRSDALLTGLFFGPVAIGLYRFGYRLVEQAIAVSLAGRSLSAVALSELSRLQNEQQSFALRVEQLLHVSATTAFPLLGVLAGVATPLLALVGDEWIPAANAVRALCVVGVVWALSQLISPVLQARGHPRRQAGITAATGALSAGSFVVAGLLLRDSAASVQVLAMALSRAGVYLFVLAPISLLVYSRYGGIAPYVVVRIVTPSVVASVAGCVVGVVLSAALPRAEAFVQQAAVLAVVGVAAATTALGLLLVIDRRARHQLRSLARTACSRVRRASRP